MEVFLKTNYVHDYILDDKKIQESDLVDMRHPGIYMPGIIKEEGKRKFNKRHWCNFCEKMKTNICKHLRTHSDEVDVCRILVAPKKEQEEMLTDLRLQHDHINNLNVRREKMGMLIVSRRPPRFYIEEYHYCSCCYEWMKMKQLSRHANQSCRKQKAEHLKVNYRDVLLQAQVLDGLIPETASDMLKKIVLPSIQNDNIGMIAKSDALIVSLGNHWITKRNKLRRKNYASHRMRLAARVLEKMRVKTMDDNMTMMQCISHTQFDLLIEAALEVAVKNDENELEHPSVSLLVGYDVRRMANIKLAWGIKKENQTWITEAEKFLTIRQIEWSDNVSNLCIALLEERKFNKGVKLPTPQDMEKFTTYCKSLLQKFDAEDTSLTNYRHGIEITQSRLISFNKRRPVEVQSLE